MLKLALTTQPLAQIQLQTSPLVSIAVPHFPRAVPEGAMMGADGSWMMGADGSILTGAGA